MSYTVDDEETVIESETGVTDSHERADIPDDSQHIPNEKIVATVKASDPIKVDTSFTSSALFRGSGGTCNNCKGNRKQRPKHCSIVDGIFQDSCSNRHCKCKCRTHALDQNGRLRRLKFIDGGGGVRTD